MTNRRSLPASTDFTQASGVPEDIATMNSAEAAPVLDNLDGDAITTPPNRLVFFDRGGDAVLTSSDANLTRLLVMMTNGYAFDRLGIFFYNNGITIEDGKIWIDVSGDEDPENDLLVGTLQTTAGSVALSIGLTEAATPALVQKLIRALTYKRPAP